MINSLPKGKIIKCEICLIISCMDENEQGKGRRGAGWGLS
jgi:hypothetical protein